MRSPGTIDPNRIWANAGAQPGDVLLLTKPLGTGVISTAIRAGQADPGMDGSRDACHEPTQ